jgi:hypothetical protein
VDPIAIATDGLSSYAAALKELELIDLHRRVDCAKTIEPKTPTCRSDDENERCRASSPTRPPSVAAVLRGRAPYCAALRLGRELGELCRPFEFNGSVRRP